MTAEEIEKFKRKHQVDQRAADHTGKSQDEVRQSLDPRLVKILQEYLQRTKTQRDARRK